MEVYLVRLAENQELVGLFATKRSGDLVYFVDECCDPNGCEYARLGQGGIYREDPGAPKVPHDIDDCTETQPDWFAGATISDYWSGFFDDDVSWKPVIG